MPPKRTSSAKRAKLEEADDNGCLSCCASFHPSAPPAIAKQEGHSYEEAKRIADFILEKTKYRPKVTMLR